MPIAGKPMIEWSIAALRAAAGVHSIVVACPPGHVHDLEGHDLGVVDGGATRSQSIANALQGVETELVAIHDAARPLVTPELVEGVVATLAAGPDAAGAIAAAPVTDTIKRAKTPPQPARGSFVKHDVTKEPREIEGTVDRGGLWAAQTPQVFRVEALRRALEADQAQIDAATDEAMLIEAMGGRVLIHPASPENFKVTTPLDLRVAELLLAERPSA